MLLCLRFVFMHPSRGCIFRSQDFIYLCIGWNSSWCRMRVERNCIRAKLKPFDMVQRISQCVLAAVPYFIYIVCIFFCDRPRHFCANGFLFAPSSRIDALSRAYNTNTDYSIRCDSDRFVWNEKENWQVHWPETILTSLCGLFYSFLFSTLSFSLLLVFFFSFFLTFALFIFAVEPNNQQQ